LPIRQARKCRRGSADKRPGKFLFGIGINWNEATII